MRTISIYNPNWGTFGGGEKYACSIAECLSRMRDVQVRLLIDRQDISRDRLSKYFNIDLAKVEHESVRPEEPRHALAAADLSIIVSNFRTHGLPAKRNVYIMQIPYPKLTGARFVKRLLSGKLKEALKDRMRRELLIDAKRADRVIVYSSFVQDVLKKHHDLSPVVLYPAIDDFQTGGKKEQMVLSVGRFFSGLYNDKRYDILIDAFKRLCDRMGGGGWRYHLVGSCGTDSSSQRYLAFLKEKARGYPIHFFVNAPYEELKDQYNAAMIFWHAAGFGLDEQKDPERMEHFGMTTVEAMSARCIPVVIDKGGQREIVAHRVSGYLWNTLDELVARTLEIVEGKAAVEHLQRQARIRYQDFSRDTFEKEVTDLFLPLLL